MKSKNEVAAYLFHQGTNYRAYEYMGVQREGAGYTFRVWAPNAQRVFLVGDFNDWSESIPMNHITDAGIWEVNLHETRVSVGDKYKYKIIGAGKELYKADPYGVIAECPPATASVVGTLDGYTWRDGGWLSHRKKKAASMYSEPMNIYELHLGSWKRHEDGSYYTYSEIAAEHIEIMPIMEHPFYGSWGYQVCSYYAPTSRYGSAYELMGFVDSMHEAGIGVILDWVPAHFPKDEHGLCEFDGQPLYEYQAYDRMENAVWGTRRFDVGRNEVQSFLVSNAMFWIEKYHVDGLRVDAVSSMLYLDYGKGQGEWTPNVYGDHRCLEAIAFFKKLNGAIKEFYPDVLMIAEESTAWPHVTGFENDGLGFDLKWNMGWMNDTLSYAKLDPIYRKYHHEKMTFSLTYAFSEKYILPISHDEVVYEKRSLLDKMSGDYWQKFAGARALAGYMMTHPGKKLTFMGCEIGQFKEWDHTREIEWFLLEYESHAKLQHYISELNHLYLETPALWQVDDSWDGFKWIDPDDRNRSILSYRRIDKQGKEVIVVINFTPVVRHGFSLGVPYEGVYEEIFNSDAEEFGGSGVLNSDELHTLAEITNYLPARLTLSLPPLGMTVLRCKRRKAKKTGK